MSVVTQQNGQQQQPQSVQLSPLQMRVKQLTFESARLLDSTANILDPGMIVAVSDIVTKNMEEIRTLNTHKDDE